MQARAYGALAEAIWSESGMMWNDAATGREARLSAKSYTGPLTMFLLSQTVCSWCLVSIGKAGLTAVPQHLPDLPYQFVIFPAHFCARPKLEIIPDY